MEGLLQSHSALGLLRGLGNRMVAQRAFSHVDGKRRKERCKLDILRTQFDDFIQREDDRCLRTELLHVSGTLLRMSKWAEHGP